jgi:hypothetical protein
LAQFGDADLAAYDAKPFDKAVMMLKGAALGVNHGLVRLALPGPRPSCQPAGGVTVPGWSLPA